MRLIDADELERRLKDLDNKTFCDRQQAVNACIAEVLAMPTAEAEPVIRCKDCRFFSIKAGFCICSCYYGIHENDYCSQAEPKGGVV